ncbi:hypothetical protein AYO40_03115 [Planctomycetaceae bacterium SCGC AG-212-D15]|nr:hypothetical protein AYO40_03115 [Planctomycetaceae bacterium SCGC AG-212-D15]
MSLASHALLSGESLERITLVEVRDWYTQVRALLEEEANMNDVPVREYACTLLFSVVGNDTAVFAQIGDGAIVAGTDAELEVVFWPQSGEYANTTNFLSDDLFSEAIAFENRCQRVEQVAMLTDGLQSLALRYAERSAHRPFFDPMFTTLVQTLDPSTLAVPLRQFLESPAVNGRTDDDKTLLLAVRTIADATEYVL